MTIAMQGETVVVTGAMVPFFETTDNREGG